MLNGESHNKQIHIFSMRQSRDTTRASEGPRDAGVIIATVRLHSSWIPKKRSPDPAVHPHVCRYGGYTQRVVGEALEQAVGLVDASVAHKRKIRTLFAELEAHEKAAEEGDGEQGREVNPAVRVGPVTTRGNLFRWANKRKPFSACSQRSYHAKHKSIKQRYSALLVAPEGAGK